VQGQLLTEAVYVWFVFAVISGV